MTKIDLWHGDCLELMKRIPDGSIDLVLTDPPYGTTNCRWDQVIPFEPMWAELKRIIKPNGAIALFGSEPFSSHLRLSNLNWFKYDWFWEKSHTPDFLQAKYKPKNYIENICVFSSGNLRKMLYQPQGLENCNISQKTRARTQNSFITSGARQKTYYQKKTGYPKTIINFSNVMGKEKKHPTQKPTKLLEFLIKTYTLENETVLDFTMGSGSTGVACKNLNRNFIGIELDESYFKIAQERIANA